MTAMQVGLIYESAVSDRNALNIVQIIARWPDDGDTLNQNALKSAWEDVTRRHEALRLVLEPLAADVPFQRLHDDVVVDFDVLDWSALERADVTDRLEGWLEDDRTAGHPLSRAPMWRVRVFRLPGRCLAMVWTFHHALLDGAGVRMVLGDVFAAYAANRQGQIPHFDPAVPPSFLKHCRDVAAIDHAPARAFFAEHLAGLETPFRLDSAFDAPRGGGRDDRRATVAARMDVGRAGRLRERAIALSTGTSTLVAAVWAIVLGRCGGRDDVVFGMTRSGRYLSREARDCVGCLVNTIPCRVALSGRSLHGVVAETAAWMRDIRPFEHIPHAEVLASLGIGQGAVGPGRALYESVLLFERSSLERSAGLIAPTLPGLTIEERSHIALTLSLSVYDDPDMLVQIDYDPARISDAGAHRLHGYVMTMLHAIADAAPGVDLPLAEVPMLPADEVARIVALSRPQAASDDAGPAPAVLDLFAERVAQAPHRCAVRQFGTDAQLTYAELDREARAIAAAIVAAGVQVGDVVALSLPRSAAYVAALLGAWRAGVAILPLDRSYPPEALRDMLARSGAVLILTDGAAGHPSEEDGLPLLRLDGIAPKDAGEAPAVPADPDRLAYVIFTSGSTGQPKGVAIPHRALAAHVAGISREFALQPEDRVLQFTSLNFDVSIEEIVPTLCAGATLVLRDDAALATVPGFLASLADHAVTVANLPTAFWTVLSAEAGQIPDSLRLLIVGGERVPAAALSRWRAAHPGVRWVNGYGPTETTITATLYDAAAWHPDQGDVPIGRPVGPARVMVAAPDGSPAPFGVAGELWIGGEGLARGYLGRPDLTAAAFLDTPASPIAARFYRTGDRVRWTGAGELAFHGRVDRQIKIRGYRIELSALEAQLEQDPAIARAVATQDRPGTAAARILIWVQPAGGAPRPEPASLMERMRAVLPPAVRPTILVVEDMPVTPAGKIDVARLPMPEIGADQPGADDAWAPAGEDVARMQAVFARTLGIEKCGPDQSFFDLGGHSLVSLRLMGRVERAFGRRLPVSLLQSAPTPRLLVAAMNGAVAPALPEGVVEVQPEGDLPPLYAVQVLGPEASLFRPLSWALGPRHPVFGISLDVFDPLTPDSIEGIAAAMARSILTHSAGRPVQLIGVSHGAHFAFELARQLREAGCDVDRLVILDATGPDGRPQRPRSLRAVLRRLATDPLGFVRHKADQLRETLGFGVEAIKDSRLAGFLTAGRRRENLTATSYGVRIDRMVSQFNPAPYGGAVTVVRATQELNDAPEAIESCLGWRRVVSGEITLVDIPGGHLTLLEAPHVERLAEVLRGPLRRPGPTDSGAGAGPVIGLGERADRGAGGADGERSESASVQDGRPLGQAGERMRPKAMGRAALR